MRSLTDPPQLPSQFLPFAETLVTGLMIAPVPVKLANTITTTILVSYATATATGAIILVSYATATGTIIPISYATAIAAIIQVCDTLLPRLQLSHVCSRAFSQPHMRQLSL